MQPSKIFTEAMQIQMAWFINEPPTATVSELYQRVFGDSPDNTNRNREPNQGNPVLWSASGPWNGLQAILNIQHNRIDAYVVPIPTTPGADRIGSVGGVFVAGG